MIIVELRSFVQTSHIRPTIDELGVPSEPWSRVHDRNQKKFSVQVPTVKSAVEEFITYIVPCAVADWRVAICCDGDGCDQHGRHKQHPI